MCSLEFHEMLQVISKNGSLNIHENSVLLSLSSGEETGPPRGHRGRFLRRRSSTSLLHSTPSLPLRTSLPPARSANQHSEVEPRSSSQGGAEQFRQLMVASLKPQCSFVLPSWVSCLQAHTSHTSQNAECNRQWLSYPRQVS